MVIPVAAIKASYLATLDSKSIRAEDAGTVRIKRRDKCSSASCVHVGSSMCQLDSRPPSILYAWYHASLTPLQVVPGRFHHNSMFQAGGN